MLCYARRVGQELVNTTKYASSQANTAFLRRPSLSFSLPHVVFDAGELLDTLRQGDKFHDAVAYLSLNGWLGPEGPSYDAAALLDGMSWSWTVSVSPPLTAAT